MKIKTVLISGALLIVAVLAMFIGNNFYQRSNSYHEGSQSIVFSIPDYEGQPYVEINQNVPFLIQRITSQRVLKFTVSGMNWEDAVWLTQTFQRI